MGVRDEPNLWSGGETDETRGVDSQNTQSNSNSLSHIEQTNSVGSKHCIKQLKKTIPDSLFHYCMHVDQ